MPAINPSAGTCSSGEGEEERHTLSLSHSLASTVPSWHPGLLLAAAPPATRTCSGPDPEHPPPSSNQDGPFARSPGSIVPRFLSPFTALPLASPPPPGAAASALGSLHLKGRGRRGLSGLWLLPAISATWLHPSQPQGGQHWQKTHCQDPGSFARIVPRPQAMHPAGLHSCKSLHAAHTSLLTARMSFDIIEKICRGSCRAQSVPSTKENQSWSWDTATVPQPPFPAQPSCERQLGGSSQTRGLRESLGAPKGVPGST